ncbi:MAG: hypothetical protein LIP01_02840 [Tannerellaceae bacterium]|nr:hypothetical protein [Tannerellaceae bacterium]
MKSPVYNIKYHAYEECVVNHFFPFILFSTVSADGFQLNSSGYFKNGGVDVMVFSDIYPEGHQGGNNIGHEQ